jgi:hypothetical protein
LREFVSAVRSTVVARLLEERLRLVEIRLLEARRAGGRLQRSLKAVKAEAAADAKKRADDKLILDAWKRA